MNEMPKGSQSPTPELSSDESLVENSYTEWLSELLEDYENVLNLSVSSGL
jgi:hypothetical protein